LLERPISPPRGWDDLRSLESVRRRPRPAQIESDPKEQQEWKKNSRRR